MKHVIVFDVGMGKRYTVIYSALKKCIFEGEIYHSRPDYIFDA